MNRLITEIAWLGGLLEGEGSFGFYANCPQIQLQITDLDVIQRAGKILNQPKIATHIRNGVSFKSNKPYHRLAVYGQNAISWMLTLYPFLGTRRRTKIREILNKWHKLPGRGVRGVDRE